MSESKEITKSQGEEMERVRQRAVVTPPVDIFENDDEILVVADVPGVTRDDVVLNFDNHRLDIEASRGDDKAEGKPLFREFQAVDYRRSFEVAPEIDSEKISAEINEGALTIHLPKSEALKPRKIQITAG